MEDMHPPTEPSGALVPPPRVPPTALATLPSFPAPQERRQRGETDLGALARLFDATLDIVDGAADSVARLLRLRNDD
jgi:hypothetical protein